MPFETKSTLDDKNQYFKNLITINLSAFIIISWVIISGWFSSFYCVVSAANVINACLEKVNQPTTEDAMKLGEVEWHHVYNSVGADSKPIQINSTVAFDEKQNESLNNTFFKRRRDKYEKDYKDGEDSIFISKIWVQLCSIIPRLVTHDLWFISEWHSFFEKIGVKIGGWGSILMTSWFGLPIFILCYALFNACAALYSWGESVFALYNQLNMTKRVENAIETTDKDIDCSVQTIIKNAIILFCYAFIVPLIGLLTMVPTLIWLFITLLFAPLYALCLPFNIQGMIKPLGIDDKTKTDKLTKLFAIYNVVLSNIYSFSGLYLVAFSIVYSIIAGIKQDVYAFIGCLVAVFILFVGLKWYKSAVPDIPEPESGGGLTASGVSANAIKDQAVLNQSEDSGAKVVEDSNGDLTNVADNPVLVPDVTPSTTNSSLATPNINTQSGEPPVVEPVIIAPENQQEVQPESVSTKSTAPDNKQEVQQGIVSTDDTTTNVSSETPTVSSAPDNQQEGPPEIVSTESTAPENKQEDQPESVSTNDTTTNVSSETPPVKTPNEKMDGGAFRNKKKSAKKR